MGAETRIYLEDIEKVAISTSGLALDDWSALSNEMRDHFMVRALNQMFTQEEQVAILHSVGAEAQIQHCDA